MSRVLGLLPAILLLAGCSRARTAPDAPREPAVRFVVDEGGPWRELPVYDEPVPVVAARTPAPRPAERVVDVAPPAAPVLPVPRRQASAPPRERGTPPAKGPEDQARERFLDHPTHITAGTITLYVPRQFAPEVRLEGEEVTDPRPGRRIAKGSARLLCRELRLEADRIVLRIQEEADAAVQVTARGDVSFVTDQRGQVLRHEHVRILVITNDGVTPLR